MVSSWLKDTCPGEAMEILSERVQIARCQARAVFASRCGRARCVLVCYMPLAVKLPGPREYDAAGIEPTLCRIREVIPQSTASSGRRTTVYLYLEPVDRGKRSVLHE